MNISRALGFASAGIDDLTCERQCEEEYGEDITDIEFEHCLTLVRNRIPVQERRFARQQTHYWVNHPMIRIAAQDAISKNDLLKRVEKLGCPPMLSNRVTTYLWS